MNKRLSIDEYYLNIAKEIASRSTCLRIHYGAILVKNNRIIATGYNGAAAGFANCNAIGICVREKLNIPHGERYELCRSVHAEANAIIQAHPDEAENSVLYLYGVDARSGKRINYSVPCEMCKRMIRNAKISEVVSYSDSNICRINPSDWIKDDLKIINDRISKLK